MKLAVIALASLTETRGHANTLRRTAEEAISHGHGVTSASGQSAAYAINYCEANGLSYTVTCLAGRYSVIAGTRQTP